MADINQIQVGNYIHYRGAHGLRDVLYAVVNSIDKTLNEEEDVYQLQDLNNYDYSFVGYSDNVRPIYLKDEILIRLGFVEKDDVFTYQNLQLFSTVISSKDENDMPLHEIIRYRTLPPFTKLPFKNKEELIKQTIAITMLHSLQNFCSENKIDIDFGQLKGFEVYY